MNAEKPTKKPPQQITIRFRSRAEVAQMKRAAKLRGQSFNMFVVFSTAAAAEAILNRTPQRDLNTLGTIQQTYTQNGL